MDSLFATQANTLINLNIKKGNLSLQKRIKYHTFNYAIDEWFKPTSFSHKRIVILVDFKQLP